MVLEWVQILDIEIFGNGESMFLCGKEEETIDHLLINCNMASALWHLLFSLFGMLWVLPFTMREALLNWSGEKTSGNNLESVSKM